MIGGRECLSAPGNTAGLYGATLVLQGENMKDFYPRKNSVPFGVK